MKCATLIRSHVLLFTEYALLRYIKANTPVEVKKQGFGGYHHHLRAQG